METTVIAFRLPDELIAALHRAAKKQGMRRSDVLRLAVLNECKRVGVLHGD